MPKILLVEDELIISEPFGIILRAHSYDVDIAANGLEALDFCSKNKYDLILLDLMMPVCNGVEFLEKASLEPKLKRTKIVLLTNLARGTEIDKALELGASKSILKAEMTPRHLVELVESELANQPKE